MKKTLILTVLFALTLVLLVAQPRSYIQKVTLSDGSLPPVTNTGATNSPDYLVTATQVRTGEVVSTATHAASQLRIALIGTGVNQFCGTTLQLAAYTSWLVGDVINMYIQHLPTMQTATWAMTVPAGTGPINIQVPVIIPPAAVTEYDLNVTSTPAGATIFKDGVTTGQVTPYTFTPGEAGTYTLAPMAGYTPWAPAEYVVPALTADVTIDFQATLLPDTYTYILHINGPDGKTVTGPVAGITDYTATDDVMADLMGDYTISAPDAGYAWDVNPITVDATGWIQTNPPLAKGNVLGTMGGDSKEVNYVFEKTIEFTQTLIPPVITPVDPTTMPAGYPMTNVVNAAYIVTWTGVHDLFIARTPTDTGALAYIGGAWLAPDGAPDWTWLNVNFDAKAPVPVVVFGPTLPVELSSFTGVMTAEYFVQLNWTTQSESNLIGYRVLRSEGTEVAEATNMTPVLIDAYNESTTHNYSFTDGEVENHTVYNYWLESVEMDGSSKFHGPVSVLVEHEVPPVVPTQTTMRNAYPNPFNVNGNTTIEVAVKEGDAGNVTIYNILGQVVKTYTVNPGNNNLTWNGKDFRGNSCGSGIYFYRLSTPSMNKTMKMVIVK